MGMARTLFLGDLGNQVDIEAVERQVAEIREKIADGLTADRSQDEVIGLLQRENAELKLYLAALVRLLLAKKAFSPEELRRIVDVVDASDGAADGQFHGEVV